MWCDMKLIIRKLNSIFMINQPLLIDESLKMVKIVILRYYPALRS